MRKVFGDWVLDINLGEFIEEALKMLIHKHTSINGDELRFIRKYLEMTSEDFGKTFGVTHIEVKSWEANEIQIPLTTEKCIRMFALEFLHAKDDDLLKLYQEINIENLAKQRKTRKRHVHQSMRFSTKKSLPAGK